MHFRKNLVTICAILVLLAAFLTLPAASYAATKSILFVTSLSELGAGGYTFMVDPVYKRQLQKEGWQVGYIALRELTWDKIKGFNVVVFTQHPDVPRNNYYDVLEQEKEVLKKYLDAGGGVFFFADLHRGRIYPHLNELLEPYGIKIWPQGIVDSNADNMKTLEAYSAVRAYRTNNITRSPITEGVKEIWYPQIGIMETVTFKANKNWKVVVRGMPTAHSESPSEVTGFEETYETQPPLAAYRQYGKGRIVMFSSHSSWYTLNPYHFMWDSGYFLKNGDAMKMLSNSYTWLAEPSLKERQLGGFLSAHQKELYDISPRLEESYPQTVSRQISGKVRKAVIGVHSTHSGGLYTVKDFADAAKKLGIDLLVFTEKPDEMDKERWLQFVADCKAVSTDAFLAIPGIHFTSVETGDEGVVFNLKKPWYDIPFKGTGFNTFVRIGVNNAWTANMALVNPTRNPISIYNLGTVNSHMLFCYAGDRLTDTDTNTFLQTSAEGWSLAPQVYSEVYAPDELGKLQDSFFTYFYSNTWGKDYDTGKNSILNSFVSNGPIIDSISLEAPHVWVEPADRVVTFSLKTHSDVPIRKVQAFIDGRVVRTFYPDNKEFETTFMVSTNANLQYNIVIEDEAGHIAYSKALGDGRSYYSHFIGSDRMNGYWYPTTPTTPDKAHLKLGGRYAVLGQTIYPGLGWGDRLSPVAYTQHDHPLGLETGSPTGGLRDITVTPMIYVPGGAEFSASAPYRRLPLNSTDCIVLKDDIKKLSTHERDEETGITRMLNPASEYIDAYVSAGAYRCPGTFLMDVATTIDVKKDFALDANKENFIVRLPFDAPADTYSSIIHRVKGSQMETTEIAFPTPFDMEDAGFVSVVDNAYGVGAIFTYEPALCTVQKYSNSPSVSVFPKLDGDTLEAGDRIQTRYLVAITQGIEKEDSATVFDGIFDSYGFDGTPAYTITTQQGTLLSNVAFPEFDAAGYGIIAEISAAELPTGLGVQVHGVNPNWDACLYDMDAGALVRNVSVMDGTAYANLDISKARSVFVGNLVTSDREALVINVYEAAPDKLYVTVHNPTDAPVEAHLASASGVNVPVVEERVSLAPGQSQQLTFVKNAQ